MPETLTATALVLAIAVCAYFGPPRQIANTVALRSSKSTDELLSAAKIDRENAIAFRCWIAGTVLAAAYGSIFGLVPSLIVVTVISMAPFLWVRTHQLNRLGRD
jgi:hypothetical protein